MKLLNITELLKRVLPTQKTRATIPDGKCASPVKRESSSVVFLHETKRYKTIKSEALASKQRRNFS